MSTRLKPALLAHINQIVFYWLMSKHFSLEESYNTSVTVCARDSCQHTLHSFSFCSPTNYIITIPLFYDEFTLLDSSSQRAVVIPTKQRTVQVLTFNSRTVKISFHHCIAAITVFWVPFDIIDLLPGCSKPIGTGWYRPCLSCVNADSQDKAKLIVCRGLTFTECQKVGENKAKWAMLRKGRSAIGNR